jgi:thioredoxin reductase
MPIPTQAPEHFDAIVVGGSYAGLSAALQLARARRRVLVVDAGRRRNRFAATSHGFLGQDGNTPQGIAVQAKAQVLAYPTVQWQDGSATHAAALGDGFTLALDTGDTFTARRLLLATGVVDEMPDAPALAGVAERWGRSIFHCPYCHGYELNQGPIGVVATGPLSYHHAMLLPDWGPVTFFTNGQCPLDDVQLAHLARRGAVVEPGLIANIQGVADVLLQDGRLFAMAGLFVGCHTRMASPLAEQLGCTIEQGPIGPFIQADASRETSVPGVFACGDTARMAGSVAIAVGDGAIAGACAHQSMVFR